MAPGAGRGSWAGAAAAGAGGGGLEDAAAAAAAEAVMSPATGSLGLRLKAATIPVGLVCDRAGVEGGDRAGV